jgi:hypothetical protein
MGGLLLVKGSAPPIGGVSGGADGAPVEHEDVLARLQAHSRAGAPETAAGAVREEGLEAANLYAVAEQLAARAAKPATQREYAAIYRSFADWLRVAARAAARRR